MTKENGNDDVDGPCCAQCGKVLPPKPSDHPNKGLGWYGDDVADPTLICAHPKCREVVRDDLGYPTGETYSMWFCGERCADEHHRLNHEDEEIEIPEEAN